MPKRKAASSEAHDVPSSLRTSRTRNAPARLNLSSFNTDHQRNSSRSSEQKESQWARSLRECEEEEVHVKNYSYTHIGDALRESSPDCWVDVPLLEAKCPLSPLLEFGGVPIEVQQEEKDLQLSLESLEAEKGKNTIAITISPVVSEGHLEEDAAPTQDEPVFTERSAESPNELDELEAGEDGIRQSAISSPIEIRVESAPDTDARERFGDAQLQNAEDANSSRSLSFLDALMDAEEVEASIAVDRGSTPSHRIDHPETSLSHSKDEEYRASSGSRQTSTSKTMPRKKDGLNGRSLFLGSDDEDDHSTRSNGMQSKRQPLAKQGTSSSSSKSTLENANRSIPAAGKGKQKQIRPAQEEVMTKAGPLKASASRTKDKTSGPKRSEIYSESGLQRRKRRRIEVKEAAIKDGKARDGRKKDEDDDLVQNLNVDAIANPNSHRREKAKRAKGLKRLQKAKQRAERKRLGEDISSSESSSSSGDSDSSEDVDSDSDSDPADFIVEDDEQPRTSTHQHKGAKRIPMPGRSPPPPTIMSRDLMTNIRSMPRREKLEEYIRWLIAYVLDMPISDRSASARDNLRKNLRADYDSLTTQANRRQFAWYLKHYPRFERRPLTREEKEDHVGCAACGRTKQKCEYLFTLSGMIYNLETLERTSDYSSSDVTTDGEDHDWKERSKDKKETYFYLGDTCAKFASVKHKLWHWERRVLNDLISLPVYKILERKWERWTNSPSSSESEDDTDSIPQYDPEDDIEAVVAYYYPTLSKRTAQLHNDAETLNLNPARYTRLREKWDDDP